MHTMNVQCKKKMHYMNGSHSYMWYVDLFYECMAVSGFEKKLLNRPLAASSQISFSFILRACEFQGSFVCFPEWAHRKIGFLEKVFSCCCCCCFYDERQTNKMEIEAYAQLYGYISISISISISNVKTALWIEHWTLSIEHIVVMQSKASSYLRALYLWVEFSATPHSSLCHIHLCFFLNLFMFPP